jgi:hypothetical protein
MKRERVIDGGGSQQHQHEDRLAPHIEEQARDQQRPLLRRCAGREQIKPKEHKKECGE